MGKKGIGIEVCGITNENYRESTTVLDNMFVRQWSMWSAYILRWLQEGQCTIVFHDELKRKVLETRKKLDSSPVTRAELVQLWSLFLKNESEVFWVFWPSLGPSLVAGIERPPGEEYASGEVQNTGAGRNLQIYETNNPQVSVQYVRKWNFLGMKKA